MPRHALAIPPLACVIGSILDEGEAAIVLRIFSCFYFFDPIRIVWQCEVNLHLHPPIACRIRQSSNSSNSLACSEFFQRKGWLPSRESNPLFSPCIALAWLADAIALHIVDYVPCGVRTRMRRPHGASAREALRRAADGGHADDDEHRGDDEREEDHDAFENRFHRRKISSKVSAI